MNRKLTILLTFLGIYLLVSGSSWALFSYLRKPPADNTNPRTKVDSDLKRKVDTNKPKTEECPINGAMYTKAEREVWEKRRPVAAMIENHVDARPLSGISRADVVYEAVAEGGITRFLAIFYCGAAAQDMEVAVVRSARVYYINWALEYGDRPIFLHWGGANNICDSCPGGVKPRGNIDPRVDAYALLNRIGWFGGSAGNDFNAGHNIGVPAVKRVKDRLQKGVDAADEHQPVAYLDAIYNEAEKRGFGFEGPDGRAWDDKFISWKFADPKPLERAVASNISFLFRTGMSEYGVEWIYDSATNSYKRMNGGQPFVDWYFNKDQVLASNVVIQFVKEEGPVDQEKHMYYLVTGKGKALVFQNGDVIEATWEKPTQFDRTIFRDMKGAEIRFVRGQIWIEAVPIGNKVSY